MDTDESYYDTLNIIFKFNASGEQIEYLYILLIRYDEWTKHISLIFEVLFAIFDTGPCKILFEHWEKYLAQHKQGSLNQPALQRTYDFFKLFSIVSLVYRSWEY